MENDEMVKTAALLAVLIPPAVLAYEVIARNGATWLMAVGGVVFLLGYGYMVTALRPQ